MKPNRGVIAAPVRLGILPAHNNDSMAATQAMSPRQPREGNRERQIKRVLTWHKDGSFPIYLARHIANGPVTRYELPAPSAVNFVIENALGGRRHDRVKSSVHDDSLSTMTLEIEFAGVTAQRG